MQVFKAICLFIILVFIGMLYWSNLLIEEDLKAIKKNLSQLELQKISPGTIERKNSDVKQLYIWNEKNLLKEDVFYSETLPNKLLPKNFVPKGERNEAAIGKPDNLNPFYSTVPFSNLIRDCSLTLGTLQFGKYETLAPYLAVSMELEGDAFLIRLRQDVFWEPLNPAFFPDDFELNPTFLERHPVTAHDIKFCFDAIMNPFMQEGGAVAERTYLADIEAVEVIDDFTLRVRWKSGNGKIKYTAKEITAGLAPLPGFVYKYFADGKKIIEDDQDPEMYRTNSVWAEQFLKHWARNVVVSCGPYIFDGFTDQEIRLKRNPNHFRPYQVLVEKRRVFLKDTPEAVWQDFKAGNIDTYSLAPSKKLEFEDFQKSSHEKIDSLQYVDRVFFYIGWNEAKPFFASKKVRQAMTMAIDRDRIIAQNLNQMGAVITGPLSADSPAYDPTLVAWPYDPHEAAKLLDEEGWVDTDGDGIRDKEINGKRIPFVFSVNYFVKSAEAKKATDLMRTFLKEVGVDCKPIGLDSLDLVSSFEDKTFDAIYFGWAQGTPPYDPRQIWHSSGAKEKGSSNAIGYANAEVDKIIDALTYESDAEKRTALYHRFHAIIHEEQPYTFLFAPKVTLLWHDYVQNIFIPRDRQDLIPGANIAQPDLDIIWIKEH